MAKASAAETRHARVAGAPRAARDLQAEPPAERYLPAVAGLQALSPEVVRLVEQVRRFVQTEVERDLGARPAYRAALARIRGTNLAACSAEDRETFFRATRSAECSARLRAADHFGLSAWRVSELEETLISGDGRMRPAQREPGDPDFWEHQGRRVARGDYKVQPEDVADTPIGAVRRELLATEDERDLERMARRRAEGRLRRSAGARRDGAKKSQAKRKARAAEERAKLRDEAITLVEKHGKSRAADFLGIGRNRLDKILAGR